MCEGLGGRRTEAGWLAGCLLLTCLCPPRFWPLPGRGGLFAAILLFFKTCARWSLRAAFISLPVTKPIIHSASARRPRPAALGAAAPARLTPPQSTPVGPGGGGAASSLAGKPGPCSLGAAGALFVRRREAARLAFPRRTPSTEGQRAPGPPRRRDAVPALAAGARAAPLAPSAAAGPGRGGRRVPSFPPPAPCSYLASAAGAQEFPVMLPGRRARHCGPGGGGTGPFARSLPRASPHARCAAAFAFAAAPLRALPGAGGRRRSRR